MTTEPALFHDSLRRVLDALDAVRVDYFVTGSLASAAHGVARATADADIGVEDLLQRLLNGDQNYRPIT